MVARARSAGNKKQHDEQGRRYGVKILVLLHRLSNRHRGLSREMLPWTCLERILSVLDSVLIIWPSSFYYGYTVFTVGQCPSRSRSCNSLACETALHSQKHVSNANAKSAKRDDSNMRRKRTA